MKSAILAVGTELTYGQIVNRNAAWISEKLKAQGFLTSMHLTVPDDRNLILEGLEFCAKRAELIFVTGGLGPTSDDFTRDLIAKWSGLDLEFNESSWQHINERLSSRGYPVKEIQRQQCYFPKGARVLTNSQGTANAFYLKTKNKQLYVLPGPPREISAIWQDFIADDIERLSKKTDKHLSFSWDTMGFGESQIAERIENIASDSGYEIGYRVHLPYVEVKFSCLQSELPKAQNYIDKIDSALIDCTICKNGEDILDGLFLKLTPYKRIEIYDPVTGGILLQRIIPELRSHKAILISCDSAPAYLQKDSLQLSLEKTSEAEVTAKIRYAEREFSATYSAQYNSLMNERKLQVFTERAIIFWSQNL